MFLCAWLYYEDYDKFIKDFKNYVLTLDDEYFNLIVDSQIQLKHMLEIFWMEKNDPKLGEEYVYETALKEHIKAIEKNGYKFNDSNKYDGFTITLRQMDYACRNKEIHDKLFNLEKELTCAHMDDILHMRTEEHWKILYSLRYLYKNVINKLVTDKQQLETYLYKNTKTLNTRDNNLTTELSFDENTPITKLYSIKTYLENYLSYYQECYEGLEWHNSFSDKLIENIEYFPRETSKPPHKYAYASYYDLEDNALSNITDMINQRKRKREEEKSEFEERFNKIHKLMEEQNNKIRNLAKYIIYGIKYGPYVSIAVGLSAFVYYYFF